MKLTLLEAVRGWVRDNGLPAAEEFVEFSVYMSALKDVATDVGLNTGPSPAVYQAGQAARAVPATQAEIPQRPVAHAIEPDRLAWPQASASYKNCLRVTAAGADRPDGTWGWPTVTDYPEAYSSAWLDPNLMTPKQAQEFGYPDPGLTAARQAEPYIEAKAVPTPAPTAAKRTPEEEAARKAALQRMVAQDQSRTSPSRRFQRSEAASLLSSTVRVDS